MRPLSALLGPLALVWATAALALTPAQHLAMRPTIPVRVENATPANLVHWRAALAAVRNGTGTAPVAFIGNSKTVGFNVTRAVSWPYAFCDELNRLGVPCSDDAFFGNDGFGGSGTGGGAGDTLTGYSAHNPQVTWPSGQNGWLCHSFTSSTGTLGGCLMEVQTIATSGVNLHFDPTDTIDQCDIYHVKNAGVGSLFYNFNGVSPVTVDDSGTPAAVIKSTITTTASNANSLHIGWIGGSGSVFPIGAVCRLTTRKTVEVLDMAWGGSTTTDWVATGKVWSPTTAIASLAPVLTVISYVTNDYTPAYGPVALNTYTTNLQTIITTAKLTGDCAIVTEVPSASSRQTYVIQSQYAAVEHALAALNGCLLIDIGLVWRNAYEPMNVRGWYTDVTHMTAAGYRYEGQLVANALMRASR